MIATPSRIGERENRQLFSLLKSKPLVGGAGARPVVAVDPSSSPSWTKPSANQAAIALLTGAHYDLTKFTDEELEQILMVTRTAIAKNGHRSVSDRN
jgi:hypothetical protein